MDNLDNVQELIRKKSIPVGNSAGVIIPRKYLGKEVLVIVEKDQRFSDEEVKKK